MTRGVSKAFEFSGRKDSYWSRQNRGALSFTSSTLELSMSSLINFVKGIISKKSPFHEGLGDNDHIMIMPIVMTF